MTGWGTADIPLLLSLPFLLMVSAFFSGSETAFFGLRAHERRVLRSREDRRAHAAEAMLNHPRMLLITLLLGNMLANVMYFVISSVLLLHTSRGDGGAVVGVAASLVFLMAMILLGEVVPKLIAARQNIAWIGICAIPLYLVHQTIAPLRIGLGRFVIAPLVRLVTPEGGVRQLDADDLASLLRVSRDEGVIDPAEARLIEDVVDLGEKKVRDIMTPRVRAVALPIEASPDEVLQVLREKRLDLLPVYREDLDNVVGVLDARRYLLASEPMLKQLLLPATFIPELATLVQLIGHFRTTNAKITVVVDEFGQTAGIVRLHDLIEELTQHGAHPDEGTPAITMVGLGCWSVTGDCSIHELADAFNLDISNTRVSTVTGWVSEQLGSYGVLGDQFTVGRWRMEVKDVQGMNITRLEITEEKEEDGA